MTRDYPLILFRSILMDSTMNVKITDLGFAVQIGENECLYDLFGTPGKSSKFLKFDLHLNFFRLYGSRITPLFSG